MKPALVLSAAILIAALIVSTSLRSLRKSVESAGFRIVQNGAGFPGQVTVLPPSGGFRVSGDFPQPVERRSVISSGSSTEAKERFAEVTNVMVVESKVTPDQLAAAPKTLLGRWRDENSYAEYRADGTCSWTLDNGTTKNNQWHIEGDTIFETGANDDKTTRRILELDDHHFVYQQFPTGSLWRAYRLPASPPAEKAP